MNYDYLSSASALREFCDAIRDAPAIYYDTEFVSEDTFRPELCLVQVSAAGRLAIIDPYEVGNVRPFWETITSGNHQTVVHAGREEFRFCWYETQKRPQQLFDVQIAAGLIGLDYPASYSKLISRLLGKKLPKGETRTNWRQRPLTDKQLEYALLDVHYLPDLRDAIVRRLESMGRMEWLEAEIANWQDDLIDSETTEKWRRVSGISGLPNKSLVLVRELWRWREQEAESQNKPPRRILRDDLLVELAKRGKAELRQITAIRGIERSGAKRYFPDIADTIAHALTLPQEKWPRASNRAVPNQVAVLGQFLNTALTSICCANSLAPSIVGTAQDVRDFVALELGFYPENEPQPRLATGWRREVVGESLCDFLRGKMSIRIEDPLSDHPLRFDEIQPDDV